MIIATNKSDVMLKKALGKGQVSILSIDKMLDQLPLDPAITEPIKDVFIITNEDVSGARIKNKFEQSLQAKHPNTKIIFINKSNKPIYPDGIPGVNAMLQKPKADELAATISDVISASAISEAAKRVGTISGVRNYDVETTGDFSFGVNESIPSKEEITAETGFIINEDEKEEETPSAIVNTEEELPQAVEDKPMEAVTTEVVKESDIVKRIRAAGSVADVSSLMREVTASTLIKDLINTNSTYAGIEEKLKSFNDIIFSIMRDTNILSLDEKLSKIRAFLHDKAFFNSKGDTIIEQRLEEVVDAICVQTSLLLQSRLDEIETAIKRSKSGDITQPVERLGGLNEKRANIIIELRVLEQEILDIFKATDTLIVESSFVIAENSDNITGSEVINNHLKARGSQIISDETLSAIRAVLDMSSTKVPEAFNNMKIKITSVLNLIGKMFDVDQEIIAAQAEIIRLLKSANIEDTVVANTLLKKSLRVFVGEEGSGRTIIPYLLSKYKSRQNANVLLIDLTGKSKYHCYGIKYRNIDKFLTEINQEEFLVVAGEVENNVTVAQRIVSALLKAADYYKVINIVMSPEQKELFQTIAPDTLCVNYLLDTNHSHINNMRNIIEETNVDNVARRVIINKCNVSTAAIINKLGLSDSIDWQLVTLGNVDIITDAGLNGYDPYGSSSVDLAIEEALRYV